MGFCSSRRASSSLAAPLLLLILGTLVLAHGCVARSGSRAPGEVTTTSPISVSTTPAGTSPASTSPLEAIQSVTRPGNKQFIPQHVRPFAFLLLTSKGECSYPARLYFTELETTPTSTAITFGCGAKLAQDLGSPDQALDGILGFGRSNSSMLSQLAAAGQARRIFAHCLDTANGGGIFAIGNIVQPKVKTTPLVPNMKNYNIKLKSIDVDGTTLPLPPDTFSGEGKGTVIDSGRTLVYLPDIIYKTITVAVFEKRPETLFHDFQDFLCFQYSGRIDDMFPKIVFHFEGDLLLNVYPHDYFLPNGSDWYCLGLRNGRSLQDMKDMVILGDLVLSNKLVVYDLEAQVLGWTDYDCSSSIKIEDDLTKSAYDVKAHRISSETSIQNQFSAVILFVFAVVLRLVG